MYWLMPSYLQLKRHAVPENPVPGEQQLFSDGLEHIWSGAAEHMCFGGFPPDVQVKFD